MINFDEEIKKYQPCLEIEEAEEAINTYDSKDMSDILSALILELKNKK
jgi:hypothetical protein